MDEERQKLYEGLQNAIIYIGNTFKYLSDSLPGIEESFNKRFGRLPPIEGLSIEQRVANLKEALNQISKEK